MKKVAVVRALFLSTIIVVSGCASIPQESVTLNKEVAAGITSIHESNVRFVNQYFDRKQAEIDAYEKEALDSFFNKIAAATAAPNAPALGVQDLYKIKEKIADINDVANKYKSELNASKELIVEKLRSEYNIIMSANSSVTGILQSAVDVDKAKNDGISKVKQLTDGKIDLTDIDTKVNDYLAKLGSASEKGTSLVESIKKSLDSNKGE